MKGAIASGWLLVGLLTVGDCSTPKVFGFVGQNVTLPCKYDVKYHGEVLHICWGIGSLPSSGCSNQILDTDGYKVVTRKSDRFQLLGRLDAGDVSLTILRATLKDSGLYSCRVQVPGWFNDEKNEARLIIKPGPKPTTPMTSDPTVTAQTTLNYTQGHMNSTEDWVTFTPHSRQSEGDENSSLLPLVLVCVLVALLALSIGGVVILIKRRWRRCKAQPRIQLLASSIQYRSSVSSLGLNNRDIAVENVYQLEGPDDYQECP